MVMGYKCFTLKSSPELSMAGVDATAAGGDEAGETLHVVLFPFLAFGHINPFAQLARSLLAVGGVRVTFLSAAANVAHVETRDHAACGRPSPSWHCICRAFRGSPRAQRARRRSTRTAPSCSSSPSTARGRRWRRCSRGSARTSCSSTSSRRGSPTLPGVSASGRRGSRSSPRSPARTSWPTGAASTARARPPRSSRRRPRGSRRRRRSPRCRPTRPPTSPTFSPASTACRARMTAPSPATTPATRSSSGPATRWKAPTSTTSRRSMASRCSPRGHWCRSHREASWRRGSRRGSPPSRTRPSSSPWTNIE
ncbi:Os11g0457000 [Oryza sativa Japonica Group]|uniref:Os11g0457000 protein n=1 Tax=Oryza sativa subsp. japonica TaxID=39947 RepID=A0A0P0Y2H6_ORYSJ|nr:hypothetical protein EE612_055389 [Oryza sativa]BAT13931.1 Os11g0457000 [Oryza sativa Japonica Group]